MSASTTLLASGAVADAVDDKGNSLLHVAALQNQHRSVAKLLPLLDPSLLSLSNGAQQTPFEVARAAGYGKVVDLLRKAASGKRARKAKRDRARTSATNDSAAPLSSSTSDVSTSSAVWQAAAPSTASKVALALGVVRGDAAKRAPLALLLEQLLEARRVLCGALFRTVALSEADRVARALSDLFERAGDALPLMKDAVRFEVAQHESPGTVFRANTLASKLLTQHANRHGHAYLAAVLLPLLRATLRRTVALEIDPTKLPATPAAEQLVSENTAQLAALFREFADAIFNSAARFPPSLRAVCAVLADEVRARFGEQHVPAAVGGFIFLRFITPAVVTPDAAAKLLAPHGGLGAATRPQHQLQR